MTDKERKNKLLNSIAANYKQVERSIAEQLYMKHDLHGSTIGSEREEIWMQLFEMVLPKKFVIEQSVFIIDARDGVSTEVDLVILDEMYTPYIFRYGRLKFIPIEAVAVVVECKSKQVKVDDIKRWYEHIKNLRTSTDSIVRIATQISEGPPPTQQSTRPIRILCTLDDEMSKNKKESLKGMVDFILIAGNSTSGKTNENNSAQSNKPHIKVEITASYSTLFEWYKDLNFYKSDQAKQNETEQDQAKQYEKGKLKVRKLEDYEVKDEEGENISLLTFNFQLNQLLMLINNPMMFPHYDYAKMFNNVEQKEKSSEIQTV